MRFKPSSVPRVGSNISAVQCSFSYPTGVAQGNVSSPSTTAHKRSGCWSCSLLKCYLASRRFGLLYFVAEGASALSFSLFHLVCLSTSCRLIVGARDWQSTNVGHAFLLIWYKPAQRLQHKPAPWCIHMLNRWNQPPLTWFQPCVTEHPQPSVRNNELMWQHPLPSNTMLINSKVARTAVINMFPWGLSPPKLPAHNVSACADFHILPYNLCCIIFCLIS